MNKRISFFLINFKIHLRHYLITSMRSLFFIMTLGLGSLFANTGNTQEKINVRVDNVSYAELFKVVQNSSDYVFFYKDAVINTNKKVSLNLQNATIETILQQAFKGANLNYVVNNKQVVIKAGSNTDTRTNTTANQQEKFLVKGTVVDAKGVPLVGANILEKGTSNGILSDFDGKFELQVKEGSATLVVSYVGFVTQQIAIQDRINVTVVLEEDLAQLGEVVIVGFGTQKKSSVVSAITSVKPEDLRIPSSNLTTAFSGAVPGMIAYQTSGEPGADNAEFFIRGVTTFGYRTEPLILIDGMESSTNDLARLDVEDIESFSIMKDATSSALYGSRGANGVILIKTKDGVKGKAKLSVKLENYFSSNTTDIEFADPVTYMTLWNEALQTRGALSGSIDKDRCKVT